MGRAFLTTTARYSHLPPKASNGTPNPTALARKRRCLSLLHSCSSMAELRQIHAHLHVSGLIADEFLAVELLRFCCLSPAGSLAYARRLLDQTPHPTPSSYNHVIRGFTLRGASTEAVRVFLDMRRRSASRPNEHTFPFMLKSCADLSALELGTQVHADALKNGTGSVVYVQNTLMHLYGTCGKIHEVKRVFHEMASKTVVSWNTILSAYVDNSGPEQSLAFFNQMRRSGLGPDHTTLVVMLSASAELGSLSFGRWIHSQIMTKGMPVNLQLGTALVNMYAKCGTISYASFVFQSMPVKNVWTWSAMILGFAQHGSARDALQLFTQMKKSSIKPNYVTFLGVLCACSHAGLADEGLHFFHEMVHMHGIQPRMTHYSAMVDILGRKGRLVEAYSFIRNMPVEPDAIVWRTLLNTCQFHSVGDANGIGEIARKRLLMLEPRRSGNYVIVANMYSEVGSWDEAARVRRMMREEGLKKMAGQSCIEVGGYVKRFVSGDDSCIDSESIHHLLTGLDLNMRLISNVDANFLIDTIKGICLLL